MSSPVETLLRLSFAAQGREDAEELARTAALAVEKAVDHNKLKRLLILADPSTDWRVVKHRYHCSRALIYKVWNSRRLVA